MGDVIDYDEAFCWSINRLSECFGMTYRTIKKRLAENGVKSAGTRNGHPVYRLSDAARAIHQVGSGPIQDLDEFPEARKAWFQSENERLKFEKELRQLVPREDAAKYLNFLGDAICSSLPRLVHQFEEVAGSSPEAVGLVKELVCGLVMHAREQATRYDGPPGQ